MKYQVDDRVKLNQDYSTASGTASKGDVGTVTKVLQLLQLDEVKFDNLNNPLKVPESYMDPA